MSTSRLLCLMSAFGTAAHYDLKVNWRCWLQTIGRKFRQATCGDLGGVRAMTGGRSTQPRIIRRMIPSKAYFRIAVHQIIPPWSADLQLTLDSMAINAIFTFHFASLDRYNHPDIIKSLVMCNVINGQRLPYPSITSRPSFHSGWEVEKLLMR